MPAIQLMAAPKTAGANVQAAADAKKPKADDVSAVFASYMQQTASGGVNVQTADTGAKQETVKPQDGAQKDYDQYQPKAPVRTDSANDRAAEDTATDAVQDAAAQIEDIIEEELGISREQLDEAMQLLGLTGADLLVPQNLIKLMGELTGAKDAGMLLVNAQFQTILQQTGEVTKELLDALGMSMEDLLTQLAEYKPQEQPKQQIPVQENTAPLQQDTKVTQTQTADVAQTAVMRNEMQEKQPQEPGSVQQPQETGDESQKVQKADQPEQQNAQPQEQGQEQFTGSRDTDMSDQKEQQMPTHNMPHAAAQQVQASPAAQSAPFGTQQPQIDIHNIIEQIVEYTRTNITEAVKSVEMQLNPENLGRIYLHITEKEGAVTAQLTAQNEGVKEALVQQMAVLRENLEQQGVRVDAVEVSVGTHEFEHNLEKNASQEQEQARQQEERAAHRTRRTIDLNSLDGMTGLMSDEEALVAQIMRDNGNNVDYKA